MNDQNTRQQIVEKITNSSNILVTVSQNPSVDELSAALGLTVMLNKMDKHATAVFSGDIPAAIEFLEPGKTFENTVDSLRDFIIALDKEKADHLRYKVDGDVVKIFITPYRTTIDEKDLDFSQGDYNVELVLALGVTSQEHLDKALEAHGRIFHDAAVATMTVGDQRSELGNIDWHDDSASSLSEMIVGLADSLKKDKPLLDEQIATALLTGIVAVTDRFSNNLTSSKVMTIAAQLMSAGANQQLIAVKLGSKDDDTTPTNGDDNNVDGSTSLAEGESSKIKKTKETKDSSKSATAESTKNSDAGQLQIAHEKQGTLDEVSAQTEREELDESAKKAQDILAKQVGAGDPATIKEAAPQDAENELADQLATITGDAADTPSVVTELQKDTAATPTSAPVPAAPQVAPESAIAPQAKPQIVAELDEPLLGGTLNATTEEAAEEERKTENDDRNRKILTHGSGTYVGDQVPIYASPLSASSNPTPAPEPQSLNDPAADTQPTAPAATIMPPASAGLTLSQLDQENRSPHEEARSAIDAAFAAQPEPQPAPQVSEQQSVTPAPAPVPNPFGVATTLPPLPDFSTLPPLPPQPGMPTQAPTAAPITGVPISPADPGQFRIPGQ